ncbi:MAG TPA: pentapeptide repeat-containing protein, partial [Actinomycetota bacterium]|nr:pentapeptide repeat-containing protein [Actinomycetota bacterium]
LLTGAGIGAAMTLRQVRVSQDGLHATREQMQHTLETTRQQLNLTEQGQVTDRYIRAVEQLGHEKAPVRLGALYSLEHLAQDNPGYRQTVVDVVCAYLRMPYTLPAQPELDAEEVEKSALPAGGRDRASHSAPGQDPAREELQVRQTAQRLLEFHLRCPPRTSGQEAQLLPPSPQHAFWPGISLDLTGAILVGFSFSEVSVIKVRFVGATFQGGARFVEATFEGPAEFGQATFEGPAIFNKATFEGPAEFGQATFRGTAWFDEATFQGDARFGQATFQGDAWFVLATFQGHAGFDQATCRRRVKTDHLPAVES